MGHVSQCKFKYEDERDIRSLLVKAPFFSSHDPVNDEYQYRGAVNLQHCYDMPDAYAKPCPAGVEFSAYGETEVVRAVWDFLLEEFRARFTGVEMEY